MVEFHITYCPIPYRTNRYMGFDHANEVKNTDGIASNVHLRWMDERVLRHFCLGKA